MKNSFIILCCFVFGMVIAKHTNTDISIPKIDTDHIINTEPVIEEVVAKKLENKTYSNWWTKGADSLDMLYSGEELIEKMKDYVHDNIAYSDTTSLRLKESTYNYSTSPYGVVTIKGTTVHSHFDTRKHIKHNLYKHKGICVDYAICFMLMCEYLNIKANCIEVPNHMLNIVNIKGKKIYVDATWNKIYLTSNDMKNAIIKSLKGEKTIYTKQYGEITYPEKFDYVYYVNSNDSNIYTAKPYNTYDAFGGCYSKEVIDIIENNI